MRPDLVRAQVAFASRPVPPRDAGLPVHQPAAFQQFLGGHRYLIGMNPIYLPFYRRHRERSGTHFEGWPLEPLGTYRVRVHQQGRGSFQSSDRLTGWLERNTTWGCIMPREVPLDPTDGEDGNVRIELVHPVHGFFRLRRLRALEYSGHLYGWQSDLERLAGQWEIGEPDPEVDPGTADSGGRRPLEQDPDWVRLMEEVDAYLRAHPGLTARAAVRALGRAVPPPRTLQAWRSRWKSLPTRAQLTQETQETLPALPPEPAP